MASHSAPYYLPKSLARLAFGGLTAAVALVLALWLPAGRSRAADDISAAPAPAAHAKIDVGLQLYSLRDQMAKDVPGTLELAHKDGITDVEVAGLYKYSAAEFRAELEKHGLHASGVHFQWDYLSRDIDKLIQDAKALGVDYVTLPWIPHKGDFTADDAHNAAAKFNEWGEKLAKAGLKFTYHPHGYEFRPQADGTTLFDLMVKETKPEFVNYEMDVFWAYHGGADPAKLLQKYPDRFVQLHLKDMKKGVATPKFTGGENQQADVALGTGQLDLPAILSAAQKIGIKHYYIEDESSASVQQIPQSIAYVRSIGF